MSQCLALTLLFLPGVYTTLTTHKHGCIGYSSYYFLKGKISPKNRLKVKKEKFSYLSITTWSNLWSGEAEGRWLGETGEPGETEEGEEREPGRHLDNDQERLRVGTFIWQSSSPLLLLLLHSVTLISSPGDTE